MSWGTITLGRMTLKETDSVDDKVNANDRSRSVVLTGQEMTFGSLTLSQLQAKAEDLVLLMDQILPISFSRKSERNGYYRVVDAGVVSTHWQGEGSWFTWNLSLSLIGPDNVVDIESRMTHVVRSNNFSIVGERWHAPAIGHQAYYIGMVSPSSTTRTGADGAITVYRGIPAVNPRWGCPVGSFVAGASRFLSASIVRSGVGVGIPPTDWELQNGLVRVRPAVAGTTTLLIALHDGTTWRERAWDIRVAGDTVVPATHFIATHVVKNSPELVAIRVLAKQPTGGNRVTLDLILRRGSKFIEGYIQRTTAGVIAVTPDVTEATTLNTGYLVSTTADGNGVKLVSGSSKTFTKNADGGPEISATLTMDFWVGAEFTGAGSGNLASDLAQQYMAVPNEQTGVIVR